MKYDISTSDNSYFDESLTNDATVAFSYQIFFFVGTQNLIINIFCLEEKIINVKGACKLTIQQTSEVLALEELALPHEAREWGGPALTQHLHPLGVQLEAEHNCWLVNLIQNIIIIHR